MSDIEKRELEIAEDIVLDAKEENEEIWANATLQNLHERKGARIEFSPERVMQKIYQLAKEHGVIINRRY